MKKIEALTAPSPTANSQTTKQPDSQAGSQQPGQNQTAMGKGPKGSRAKKGTWGEETAGAKTNEGADEGREDAVPVGGAAAERFGDPGAAAHQLPAPLAALSAHEIPILFTPGLPILRMARTHGVGMPAVFTPLIQLSVQLSQTPAGHQSAGPV